MSRLPGSDPAGLASVSACQRRLHLVIRDGLDHAEAIWSAWSSLDRVIAACRGHGVRSSLADDGSGRGGPSTHKARPSDSRDLDQSNLRLQSGVLALAADLLVARSRRVVVRAAVVFRELCTRGLVRCRRSAGSRARTANCTCAIGAREDGSLHSLTLLLGSAGLNGNCSALGNTDRRRDRCREGERDHLAFLLASRSGGSGEYVVARGRIRHSLHDLLLGDRRAARRDESRLLEEGREVLNELGLVDAEIVVEQEQELNLHQVYARE